MEKAITRVEIIEAVGGAFQGGAIRRDGLVTAAREAGARREVLDLLSRLPDEQFRGIRDLWIDLHYLPVGA